MATINDQLLNIRNLRSVYNEMDQAGYTAALQLQQQKAALQQALRRPRRHRFNTQQLQAAVNQQQTAVNNAKTQLATAQTNLQQAIAVLYQPGPQQLTSQLNDGIYFRPPARIRIKTRCQTRHQKHGELWVRGYDDIAIHTHEEVLTGAEVTAGETYWTALYIAITTGGSAAEDQKKTAWSILVTRSAPRSAWVAQQTKPTNWTDTLAGITNAGQLIFPVISQTKTLAWSRAPRSKVMPDKFVVMLFNGSTKVQEITGGNQLPH